MAFTDRSDLFGSVHEEAFNRVVQHIMRQRPSLFNYATAIFHQRPELFCARIAADKRVLDAGNPLFTEQEPLPIMGAPVPLGLNFCLQLTDAQIDFHPGNVFTLPPELGELPPQRFGLRLRACAGLDCPPRDIIDRLIPALETLVFRDMVEGGDIKEQPSPAGVIPGHTPTTRRMAAATHVPRTDVLVAATPAALGDFRPTRDDVLVLPTRELMCFCLELYGVGHFEWGQVAGSNQAWLKTRLDGLEIVDLQPQPMESALECFFATTLRLGILPRLIMPMEKLVLDITSQMREIGLELGKQVSLMPSAVPADVPNNPAVEEDQIKVFAKLVIT